jgi:hypothetical protein
MDAIDPAAGPVTVVVAAGSTGGKPVPLAARPTNHAAALSILGALLAAGADPLTTVVVRGNGAARQGDGGASTWTIVHVAAHQGDTRAAQLLASAARNTVSARTDAGGDADGEKPTGAAADDRDKVLASAAEEAVRGYREAHRKGGAAAASSRHSTGNNNNNNNNNSSNNTGDSNNRKGSGDDDQDGGLGATAGSGSRWAQVAEILLGTGVVEAAKSGNATVLKLLLDAGASVHGSAGKDGEEDEEAPLHAAIRAVPRGLVELPEGDNNVGGRRCFFFFF